MAEEFVRKEHVEAFTRRFGGRFLGVEKRMEQGFAHAEKAREQNKAVLGILTGVAKYLFFPG